MKLAEFIDKHPVVPYVRQSEHAVRKPWGYRNRRLLDYLIVYVQAGYFRVVADGQTYDFREGDLCVLQPGTLVELYGLTDTITPYAHLDFFYNPEREAGFPTRPGQVDLTAYAHLLQPRLDKLAGVPIPVRVESKDAARLRDSLLRVVEFFPGTDVHSKLKTQLGASDFFLALLEACCPDDGPSRGSPTALNWIFSYLSLHLSEPVSVQNMADKANLSVSRFMVLFKRQFGQSPHQYLLNMRLGHARELLETTALSQEEIADYCGFAHLHHLSKAFRKRFGMPPGAVRKRNGT